MEIESANRHVVSSGVLSSGSFGMDEEDAAHIFRILRGTLYSAKERALVREYYSNARDAHVDAGCPDRPVKIVLPTEISPTFTIRDFGKGLSEQDIYTVYSKYGKSTKRNSNTTIGFMGIGAKSAFCYTDTFTITSFHAGIKSVYVSVLDETDIGRIDKLYEEPCEQETGIEISIPVQKKDIETFHKEASYILQFASPPPEINIPIETREINSKSVGFLVKENPKPGTWIAIMGGIPYILNLGHLLDDLRDGCVENMAPSCEGGLFFELGEISVAASREEVEYTPRTKAAIVRKLRLLWDGVLGELEQTLSDETVQSWHKRIAAFAFQKNTGAPVPSAYKKWITDNAWLYSSDRVRDGDGNLKRDEDGNYYTEVPDTFRLYGYGHRRRYHERGELSHKLEENSYLPIEVGTRILVKDTPLSVKTCDPTFTDRVVVPNMGANLAEVMIELNILLKEKELEGIPIYMVSSVAKKVPRTKNLNQKHKQSCFVLSNRPVKKPLSDCWDAATHIIESDDVFVVLDNFQAHPDFYHDLRHDRNVLTYFGMQFPSIFGLKTTAKRRIHIDDVCATHYTAWSKKVYAELISKVRDEIDLYRWVNLSIDRYTSHYSDNPLDVYLKALGPDHILTKLFVSQRKAVSLYQNLTQQYRDVLRRLDAVDSTPDCAALELQRAFARYPLMDPQNRGPGFGVVGYRTPATVAWLQYISLIDKDSK